MLVGVGVGTGSSRVKGVRTQKLTCERWCVVCAFGSGVSEILELCVSVSPFSFQNRPLKRRAIW